MSNQDPIEPNPEDLEKLMRQFLESGNLNPEELAKVAGLPIDPAQIAAIMSSLTQAMSDTSQGVNWEMAQQQALAIVRGDDNQISVSESEMIDEGFRMAQLWLSEITEITTTASPKHYSKGAWVQDAIPLFRNLAEPIATSMGKALSENLTTLLPENMNVGGGAANLIQNAGSAIFAMQLGQTIGKMAQEALTAGEIGIPLSDRPGIVFQNLKTYGSDLEVPFEELIIYLAIRELATVGLFSTRPWLRDQIATQIREYAAGLTVDIEQIQNLSESYNPENPSEFTFAIEQGALISPRTEEQQKALERIEFMLALIEGWVEAVAQFAGRRLSKVSAISEAIRRRRVSGGAAEKTFGTLLGLELRPRLAREALSLWQQVGNELGNTQRDIVWDHPDMLPTQSELDNPQQLIARLGSAGDDLDDQLREFLS